MRSNLYSLAVVALVISTFGCKPKVGELEGSVFIVTKGRENVKLGLVTVNLHDAKTARASVRSFLVQLETQANDVRVEATPLALSVQKLCADAKPIADEYDARPTASIRGRLEAKREEINKVTRDFNNKIEPLNRQVRNYERLCYEAIRQPLASVKTDADGKFRVEMPRNGEFIITASTSRAVGNRSEEYIWVMSVSLEGKQRAQIFLSNDNMMSSDSPESAIPKPSFQPLEPLKEMPPFR